MKTLKIILVLVIISSFILISRMMVKNISNDKENLSIKIDKARVVCDEAGGDLIGNQSFGFICLKKGTIIKGLKVSDYKQSCDSTQLNCYNGERLLVTGRKDEEKVMMK